MDKRTFIKALGGGVATFSLASTASLVPAATGSSHGHLPSAIYPPSIRRGDTIGIITPSSPLWDDEGYAIADRNFSILGLRIKWGQHVGQKHGFLAGKD